MRAGSLARVALAGVIVLTMVACGERTATISKTEKLIADRNYQAALIELKGVIQQNPNSPQARLMLGTVLLEQNKYQDALLEFEKARDLGLNKGLLAPKLARVLLSLGRTQEAVEIAKDAESSETVDQAELLTVLAIGYARLNQREDADRTIDRALEVDPQYAWALLTKARFLGAKGQFDKGLDLIDKAIATNQRPGDAYLLRGQFLRHAKGDEEGAIAAFEHAAADPSYELSARSYLIDALLRRGQFNAARAQLKLLKTSQPDSLQYVFLEGVIAFATKDFARAEELADQLLRYDPDNARLLALAGAAALSRGSFVTAEAKLGKLVLAEPKAMGARRMLAEVYLKTGQLEKARQALRPLLEMRQPDPAAQILAGKVELMAGNVDEAEAMFKAATVVAPEDTQARTSLALIDLARGHAEEALSTLAAIASKDPGDSVDLALISAHLRRREYDAAMHAIDALERKLPGRPTTSHLRGIALRAKGDLSGARAAFEAALKLAPTYSASIISLAALDDTEGHPDAARQRLVAGIASDPRSVALRMALVDHLSRQKASTRELLAVIDEAIDLAPQQTAPRAAKVAVLMDSGDSKAAAAAAQDALAVLPDQPQLLEVAGLALDAAGDHQQAISTLTRLAALTPRSPRPQLLLADLHARRGESTAAVASLRRALELAPTSAAVRAAMVSRSRATRDFAWALADARRLQRDLPKQAAGFELEADLLNAQRKGHLAVAPLRQAITRSPSTGLAIKLHRALHGDGQADAAEKFAAEWLRAHPKDAAFLAFLGERARQQGRLAEAERYFRSALELEPEHVGVLNNLAWVLGQLDRPDALPVARKAVELRPGEPELVDTLSVLLLKHHNVEEALSLVRQALREKPGDPLLELALARALVAAGKPDDAKDLLAKLSKLGRSFQYQAEVAALTRAQRP